jgi:hypothetical protein
VTELRYSLAREFARDPGPRYKKQGPNSGEAFRAVLRDLLGRGGIVRINLDGTSGIGSSFLDEAFGGLIFAEGMQASDVLARIKLESSDDETYILDIMESIEKAQKQKKY